MQLSAGGQVEAPALGRSSGGGQLSGLTIPRFRVGGRLGAIEGDLLGRMRRVRGRSRSSSVVPTVAKEAFWRAIVRVDKPAGGGLGAIEGDLLLGRMRRVRGRSRCSSVVPTVAKEGFGVQLSAGGQVEAPTRAAAAAAASRTARCRAADGKLVCPRCRVDFS